LATNAENRAISVDSRDKPKNDMRRTSPRMTGDVKPKNDR
jgi:hypothetical protein